MSRVHRRALIGGLAAGLAAPAVAQTRPFRIVMVTFRGWTDSDRGFVDHLRRRRVPVQVDHIDLQGQFANGAAAVQRIRETKPDLVYVWGTGVALAVLGRRDAPGDRFVKDIPTIFINVTDPIASGLVADLGPTRGLVTGSTFLAPVEAQLTALRNYRRIKKLGIVYNPQESNAKAISDRVAALSPRFEMETVIRPLTLHDGEPSSSDIARAVADLKVAGAEMVFVPPDSFLSNRRKLLGDAAITYDMPTMGAAEGTVGDSQLLMGLIARYYNVGILAGYQAERVLARKEDIGSIPIENLKRFSFVVRAQTARQLEFFPPLGLMSYAEFI